MTAMKTIPLELTTLNNWLTWHYEYKEGKEKPLKVPNVPKDWYNKPMKSFNEVVAEQANNNVGIGIAMTATNRIVGIDLDNIDDKAIPPKLKAILTIGKKGGYIERSVSKTGYHIIGECTFKELLLDMFRQYNKGTGAKSSDKHLEMYASEHYFTVSGYTVYCDWKNIDGAVIAAWEYITGQSFLESVAVCFGQPLHNDLFTNPQKPIQPPPNESVAVINHEQKRSDIKPPTKELPWPQDAYTDEEIQKLPKLGIKRTIELMYRSKPILKRILTEDGHDAAAEYYQLNPTKNTAKDTSPSGFDQEIAGSLCFWLKRYGPEEIIKLMENSKLNRHDKGKEYWINTVNNAYSKAFLYFTATPKLDEDKAKKVQAWRNHKQKLAALMGLKN